MKITNYQLSETKYQESPNHSGKFKAGDLDTIIIHYTAGGSASSAINTLTNPNVKASAHLVVDFEGEITQLVKFDTIAWHAGASQYQGRTGYNKYSIGIEIVNAGVLEKSGNKYISWFGKKYDEEDVIAAVHRNQNSTKYWHKYTEKQIDVVEEICRVLIAEYNIRKILGHEEISPGRKIDPGPAFPLDKMRGRLFGTGRDYDGPEEKELKEMFVNADGLNIRSNPGTNSEKIAKPLPKGKKVIVIRTKGGWSEVKAEITGWVSSKHLKD